MIRAFTISLLFFFLADAVGCILFLFVDWYEIRKEMTHFLDSKEAKKNAVTLNLDKKEFDKLQWIEKDHEFFYEGKLYDIISSQKENDITKFRCIVDEREASFFRTMEILVTHEQSDSNHEHTILINVFKFLSSLVFQILNFPVHHDMASIRPTEAYTNRYHFIFHSIPIQPPNQVS